MLYYFDVFLFIESFNFFLGILRIKYNDRKGYFYFDLYEFNFNNVFYRVNEIYIWSRCLICLML